MSTVPKPAGSIIGLDLTVPNAENVRDFYQQVVGWSATGMDMGGYEDFFMNIATTGETVAGVCHLRGENADLPAAWLTYVQVDDLEASVAKAVALGGQQLTPIKGDAASMQYCVIRDPAGACIALSHLAAGAEE